MPRRPHCSLIGFWLLVIGVGVPGCQTTTIKSLPTTPPDPPSQAIGPGDGPGVGMTIDQAIGTDPAISRMQQLQEALVMHYALHHQLPATLNDLQPPAGGGEVPTTDPSGRPYLYSQAGLTALGTTKRLFVAAPAPSPSGTRLCILMAPIAGPGAPIGPEVLDVPETVFRQYGP